MSKAVVRPLAEEAESAHKPSESVRTGVVAWVLVAVYYFYQYTLRSAPSVMMPQLSDAFGLNALGVASIVGLLCGVFAVQSVRQEV